MSEGARTAAKADEDVVGSGRVRELEHASATSNSCPATLEIEVLKEALAAAREKKPSWQSPSPPPGGSREGRGRNTQRRSFQLG